MKVIFLDVDGVLMHRSSLTSKRWSEPDPACVERLNRIIEATGAFIVLSSSHRIGLTRIECCDMLSQWGIKGKVLDRTGRDLDVRGHEIAEWIAEYTRHRDLDKYIILDDGSDMADLADDLVKCTFEFGLTDELADECIRRLQCSCPKDTGYAESCSVHGENPQLYER